MKQIEYIRELGERVKVKYTPRSKLLGPKFGKDVQDIIRMVKEGKIQSISGGRYQVGDFVLNSEDVEVGYEAQDGAGVASENGYTLLLDTHISEDLVQEGVAREMVRFIQDMRKEAAYDVSDRISLVIESEHPEITTAVTAFADYIRKETLAEELQQGGVFESDLKKIMEMDTYKITVAIRKN